MYRRKGGVYRMKGLKLQPGSLLLENPIFDPPKTLTVLGCDATARPGKGGVVAAELRGLGKILLVSKDDFRKRSCRDAKERVSSSLPGPSRGGPKEEVVKANFLGASSSIPVLPRQGYLWGGEGNFHPVA